MQKNLIFIFVVLCLISVAFIVVSLLVFITRGNHSSLLAKKLLIGGLILTLTAMINSYAVAQSDDDGEIDIVICYVIVKVNKMFLNDYQGASGGPIPYSSHIDGTICNRDSNVFSYKLTTEDGKVVKIGSIEALDGAFNEYDEEFSIEIDKSIPEGIYILYLYSVSVEEQENVAYYESMYKISIDYND